jgi:NTE family protein
MTLETKKSTVAERVLALKADGPVRALTKTQIRSRVRGMSLTTPYADAVFEGGGVKGLAFVGAIQVAEELGVQWKSVAGTSAGAITACLLAAGYSADELKRVLMDLDFKEFLDEGLLDRIPLLGKIASAVFEKGIYEGDFFERWIAKMLREKGVTTFGELKEGQQHRLKLIASDVTRKEMVVVPDDVGVYGREPDRFPIARGARMSMSIPYFFEPVVMDYAVPNEGRTTKVNVVDGGLLSNFPVWIFDAAPGSAPRWPTFGFKLIEPDSDKVDQAKWPHEYVMALVNTMLEAHDKAYISEANFERTVAVPTMGIHTTQFDLSKDDKNLLIRAGQEAAIRFFETWDFEKHNRDHDRA